MPLFLKKTWSDDLCVGIWKIEEPEIFFQERLQPAEFADACRSIHAPGRRLERCAVRLLLRELTGKCMKILYTEKGKPYLEDNSFNISITHTNGYAAIALHPAHETGIDIEKPASRILKIREHVFSQPEINRINSLDVQKQILYSTLYWCAKETVFKIVGNDVYDYKHTIMVPPFQIKKEGTFPLKMPCSEKESSLDISYKIYEDFILTWCVRL